MNIRINGRGVKFEAARGISVTVMKLTSPSITLDTQTAKYPWVERQYKPPRWRASYGVTPQADLVKHKLRRAGDQGRVLTVDKEQKCCLLRVVVRIGKVHLRLPSTRALDLALWFRIINLIFVINRHSLSLLGLRSLRRHHCVQERLGYTLAIDATDGLRRRGIRRH